MLILFPVCCRTQEPDNEEQQPPTAMQCASSGQSLAPAHASTSFPAAQAGHQWPWWAQVVGAHQPHPISTLQQGQPPAATASWEGQQGAQGVHSGTWGCGSDHQTQFNGSGLWAQGMPCSTPWGR